MVGSKKIENKIDRFPLHIPIVNEKPPGVKLL